MDPAARLRGLEKRWEIEAQRKRGTDRQHLARIQEQLAQRLPATEAQGYMDRETRRLLDEADQLKDRIAFHAGLKRTFWFLMSPLILIAVLCVYTAIFVVPPQ